MSTHINKEGNPVMVDVTDKLPTLRIAKAKTIMTFNDEAFAMLKSGYAKKGDILSVATTAGIMAAKNTSNMIPMCHPIMLTNITIDYEFKNNELEIVSTVKTKGETGVEMEALTSSSITALTIYDMLKSVQKDMVIKETKLLSKSGGKSDYESN